MAARSHNPGEAGVQSMAALRDGAAELILIGRLGDRLCAVPAAAVVRILRMAALTPLPDARPGLAGLLNLHGDVLPVVDPRPLLGLPTPPAHPDQHLVVMSVGTRFLLWLDRIEQIVSAPPQDFETVDVGARRPLSSFVVRVDGEVVPVLSPDALDPGPILQPAHPRSE